MEEKLTKKIKANIQPIKEVYPYEEIALDVYPLKNI
jgi:hypothetical protein